jgi:DNA-binding NarL/FixJ family response regulator
MEAAEAFRACGTTLYAAEAAAAARSIRLAAGDARGAGAAERLAEAMRAEVPSAVTPLLGAKRSATGPLSTREHEIADLAARGLSNRAIAKRLYVSERTVENHLYRVFIKLGISARDQLPAALGLSHL